jgi:hypothetical protein
VFSIDIWIPLRVYTLLMNFRVVSMLSISWASVPPGALLGGWLASSFALRPVFFIVVAGLFLAQLWLVFSPLRSLPQQKDR